MGDPAQPSRNQSRCTPSFFGDIPVRSPELNALSPTASEGEDRELNYNYINNNVDSFSDFGVMRNVIYKLNKESDSDWGDNEHETTSPSDNDALSLHCVKCKKDSSQPGNNCCYCAHVKRNPKRKKSEKKRQQKRKAIPAAFEISMFQPSSVDDPNKAGCSIRNINPEGKPPVHNGAPRATRFYVSNKKMTRKRNLQVSSSSSTGSDSPRDIISTAGTHGGLKPKDSNNIATDMCPHCNMRPRNAVIIHGEIGHQCFCYRCTMKLWRENGNCPMCQHKIHKVIRNLL